MLYPSDFEKKIGFDQIRELLKGLCLSGLGKEEVAKIRFSADHTEITSWLAQTEEFRQILLSGRPLPLQEYSNCIPLLNRLRIENTWPEPEQLADLRNTLAIFIDILDFFTEEQQMAYPELARLVEESQKYEECNCEERSDKARRNTKEEDSSFYPDPSTRILDRINQVIDEKAKIRDSASKELNRIRREIGRLQGGVEKRMRQIFAEARNSGWTDEDAEVTIRDGRLVIPFRSAHKRKIRGVVHDASSTGQTVYLEPVELFEMNNEIRELFFAEKREIIRIMIQAANQIRPHIDELIAINQLLGQLDGIRAKASFALQTGGMLCSRVENSPYLDWKQAVHPLLFLAHKKANKSVVPLTISLHPGQQVLVISGPNAGGKSICLKTVGLLQYMWQCGLLPPVREDSGFGIFRQLMIDIGDEQSLENDLSTYTSKLLNMKCFLEHLDERSLFLIDEMGSGTDPSIGGGIAEAALLSMAESGAYGVVTTHYSNLKLLADKQTSEQADKRTSGRLDKRTAKSGIINGAMLFDTKTMKPLYKLKIGKPGSSFAIEIAKGIGFPDRELKRASELIGENRLDFERQLQDLELEKEEMQKRSTELQVADEFLHELITKYQQLTGEVARSRLEILKKAREEAAQLLKDSNKLIERTIKEIRESQADKDRTKKAREEIRMRNRSEAELGGANEELSSHESRVTSHVGDLFVPSFESLVVKRNEAPKSETCHCGEPKLRAHREAGSDAAKRKAKSNYPDIIRSKQESFTLTLDLRGKRVEEAFIALQSFIDDAILLSVKEVRILHGKGTGALREVTRDYLRQVKEVKSFHDERVERGGAGITVVNLA